MGAIRMQRLCPFGEVTTQKIVYINPALVRAVRPSSSDSEIVFDENHSIFVHDPAEQVVKALDGAK